eukprot:SAG11_NODE_3018_length_2759_cov_2.253383_1_plen_88_part_00
MHIGRAGEVQAKRAAVGLDDAVLAVVKQHGGDNLGLRNITELTRAASNCARTHKIRCYHADCQTQRSEKKGAVVHSLTRVEKSCGGW